MTTKASALHLVGIFAEAEMRAESMATSMFLSCMLSQSLDAYEDTKKQYQDALASDADEQELRLKEMMFKASAMSIQMTADMFVSNQKETYD